MADTETNKRKIKELLENGALWKLGKGEKPLAYVARICEDIQKTGGHEALSHSCFGLMLNALSALERKCSVTGAATEVVRLTAKWITSSGERGYVPSNLTRLSGGLTGVRSHITVPEHFVIVNGAEACFRASKKPARAMVCLLQYDQDPAFTVGIVKTILRGWAVGNRDQAASFFLESTAKATR